MVHAKVEGLPASMPTASKNDPLACYSGDPSKVTVLIFQNVPDLILWSFGASTAGRIRGTFSPGPKI